MNALCHEIAEGLDENGRQCCIRCGFAVVDYSGGGMMTTMPEDGAPPASLRGFAGGRITVVQDGPITETTPGNTYWRSGAEHIAPDCEWKVTA